MDPGSLSPGTILAVGLVIYSIILHEIAHGYAALKFGDETALRNNRLTLNPLEHIDPVGTIVFPILQLLLVGRVLIGWAKPVPVNPYNLEPRTAGEIVVAVAGVFVNFLIALLMAVILGFVRGPIEDVLATVLFSNIALMVFNLLPIPPLDGSHVFEKLLPPDLRAAYRQIGFYGIFILLLLSRAGALRAITGPIVGRIVDFLVSDVTLRIRGLLHT
jgi:Zn-dependent protease